MRPMLFEENLLVLSPQLAVAIGLNEAIVIQQMHYWLKKSKIVVDGKPWVYNTYDEWAEQFPFWSLRTIRTIFENLRKGELIESRKLAASAWDKTNYYTIRYPKLEQLGVLFAPALGVPGGEPGAESGPGGSGYKPANTDVAKSGASNGGNDTTDAAKSGASKRQKPARRSGKSRRVEVAAPGASLTETTSETTSETPAETPLTAPAPAGSGAALEGEFLGAEACAEEAKPRREIPADMPGPKDRSCKTFKAWANYACAYRKRYGVWPAWNAQAGGMLGKVIDRIGADLAPKVAAFYIGINDARLVRECHPLSLLLQGCEGYRTQHLTGRQMNGTTARQIEATQANVNAAQEAAARIRARAEGGVTDDNPFLR